MQDIWKIGKRGIILNRVYKVIFNRTKGQYEVVPEIAKNGGKAPKRSTGRHVHHSAGILPTAALLSSLLFSGGTCAAAASTTVNSGDTIEAGANISVTKDDAGKNIVIAAPDVATKDELNQVESTATDNTGKISTNTQNIATNTKNISDNKKLIEKNAKDIAENKTAIGNNSTTINRNTSAINENKTDIAANEKAIKKISPIFPRIRQISLIIEL